MKVLSIIKVLIGIGLGIFMLTLVAEAKTGKQVYMSTCAICHSSNDMGAPKTQDAKAWKKIILKTKISRSTMHSRTKLINKLVKQATKGIGAMPAKGNCADCTTAELKAAIEYMVPKNLH